MKVIIFLENIQSGGLDTFCSLLINNWPNKDDQIVLVCNNSHPGKINLKNAITRQCDFYYHKAPISWSFSSKLFLFGFERITRPFLRVFLFLFQYLTIKNIFHQVQGNELIVVNGGFPGGESCRIANIVWSKMGRGLSIHNFHGSAILPKFGFGWYENAIDKALLTSVKSFIGVSHSCAESLKKRDSFKNSSNIKYIYNGIVDSSLDAPQLNIRKLFMIDNNPLCLMLGSYDAQKGHEFIFKAFSHVLDTFPKAHLVTCGVGTENEISFIEHLVEKGSLGGNVHTLGFVPNGASLIKQADVLLIGSQEFESFGFTAAEAMIRSTPVVSTNIGGLPEVIGTDGSCGYVVDPNDVVGFSNGIVSLLHDKKLRELMGSSGRSRALKMFDVNRMAQEYLDAILE